MLCLTLQNRFSCSNHEIIGRNGTTLRIYQEELSFLNMCLYSQPRERSSAFIYIAENTLFKKLSCEISLPDRNY